MAIKSTTLINKLNKKYGDNITMLASGLERIDMISSGSNKMDIILGGGLPVGRMIEYYGPNSSGKTTMALKTSKSIQEKGGTVLYVDAECGINTDRLSQFGIKLEELILVRPTDGNQALDIVKDSVEMGGIDLVVIDSIDTLVPRAELGGDSGESNMGVKARMINQFLRKITNLININKTTIIFINQVRMNIKTGYEENPGGRGLPYYCSQRVRFFKSFAKKNAIVDEDGDNIGVTISVTIEKNRFSSPGKKAEFGLLFNGDILEYNGIIDELVNYDIIKRDAMTFYIGDKKIGIRKKLIGLFKDDKRLYDRLCLELINKIKGDG